ncbi:RTA1 like protein-domain-containing protein [Dactylonectria macrodidyma]|uniref:RTA1 like protein-domain-containing protein n=1 Tax=Dactylonectria macrodidyma TaxID=307937 RepID=A0A9P9IJU3_9HYPO|nr:RTA1 like protein-domain-containing protein [Dactylonectria macrodidyma]
MTSASDASDDSGFKLYHYDPSFAGAVIFALSFGAVSIRHLQLIFKTRTWAFIPFFIGCLFETVGYGARAYSARQTPDWSLIPYIMQSMLILLGPALFAASIYMVLGRLIRVLDGQEYSLIRVRWLTKFFLLGDILSIFGQSGGGGILASANSDSSMKLGNNVILLGLAIQLIFFGFFIIVTAVFHVRVLQRPTPRSQATSSPWKGFILVLYLASFLIMVRSLFRMVEYAQGNDGSLIKKEVYVYVLDALLMVAVAVLFSVYHPSNVLVEHKILESGVNFGGSSDTYPMVAGGGRYTNVD